jgi:hypothetical protein
MNHCEFTVIVISNPGDGRLTMKQPLRMLFFPKQKKLCIWSDKLMLTISNQGEIGQTNPLLSTPTIAENASVGSAVATLNGVDENMSATFSYALVSGLEGQIILNSR